MTTLVDAVIVETADNAKRGTSWNIAKCALQKAITELESGPDGRDFYRFAWNSAVDLAGQIAKRLGWDMNEEPPEGMLTVLQLVEEHADASDAEIARLKADLARALESSPVVPLEERNSAILQAITDPENQPSQFGTVRLSTLVELAAMARRCAEKAKTEEAEQYCERIAEAIESAMGPTVPGVPLEERRDAARYRFVRDAYTGGDMDENAMTLTVPGACLSGTTLNAEGFDKAIDAAISLPPQGDSTNG